MTVSAKKDSAGKLALLGIQHVFAMFGATVLVPMLTGMSPAVALFCAGVGTWIFHLCTGRKVPTFLGSSFAFIAAIQGAAQICSDNAEIGTDADLAARPYATGGIIVAGALYLVLALLVTPAATARLLCDRLGTMMILSPMLGASGGLVGLYLSWALDVPTGATIVLVLTACFVLAWVFAPRHGLLARSLRERRG